MSRTLRKFNDNRVFHRQIRVTSSGSAGSATGVGYIPLPPCRLTHVKVDFHASAPATTDTTLKINGLSDGSTGSTVLTVTNSATDIPWRALGQPNAVDEGRNTTGTAGAYTDGIEGGAFIKNGLSVNLAQTDALTDAVIVDLMFERLWMEPIELVAQTGADGTGAVTRTLDFARAGVLLGLEFDFQNVPATTDVVIKDTDTNGTTLFTSTNSATDFGQVGLGIIGIDEANAATAATDAVAGGQPFRRGLYFDVAQSDIFTSGNEKVVVYPWVRV